MDNSQQTSSLFRHIKRLLEDVHLVNWLSTLIWPNTTAIVSIIAGMALAVWARVINLPMPEVVLVLLIAFAVFLVILQVLIHIGTSHVRYARTLIVFLVIILIAVSVRIVADALEPEAAPGPRDGRLAYVLAAIGFVLSGLFLALARRLREVRVLEPFRPTDERRYRNVLDLSRGVYYLLGMSAEEFQRHVPLKDYFEQRLREGSPIHELRFLLLHPDSPHFRNRLLEVNAGSDVRHLVERKKEFIRSLHLGFVSLPAAIRPHFEIRFYDNYPIWILQLFNGDSASAPDARPDSIVICAHGAGRHAKFSPQYRISRESEDLFHSFLCFFEKTWDAALPMSTDGIFPKVYARDDRGIKLLIFDLDGTIVDSDNAKRWAFLASYADASDPKVITLVYEQHKGKPREKIFQIAQEALGLPGDAPAIDARRQNFSNAYYSRAFPPPLFPGFLDFIRLIGPKYRLAIVSNAPDAEIADVLAAHGLQDQFAFVSGAPTSKGEGVRRVLRALELDTTDAVYIGDTDEDRAVCESFGISFLEHIPSSKLKTSPDQFTSYDKLRRILFEREVSGYPQAKQ